MTKEEKAIIYFKDLRKRFCEDYLLGIPKNTVAYKATMAEKEFYDTAIKALEQERSRSAEIIQYRYDCEKLMEENERLKKALEQETVSKESYDHEYFLRKEYEIKIAKLEQQEPCEEVVSRDAVEDAIANEVVNGESLGYSVAQDILSDLPPVTLKLKRGKWIDDKCSVCGKGTEDLIDSREWYRKEEPNFCPFCGIKLLNPQAESEGKE